MARYALTIKAVSDLNSIWEYTFESWSENQADKYYNLILNTCQSIADKPWIGKNYHGVANDLFGFKINKHIVFYRKSLDKPIEITRILHERMDLKSRLNK